jgi:hypothetical protein
MWRSSPTWRGGHDELGVPPPPRNAGPAAHRSGAEARGQRPPRAGETAAREHLAPSAFLSRVLTRQMERKDDRLIATMLTFSEHPGGKTLESFDCRLPSPRSIADSSRAWPPAALCASDSMSCFPGHLLSGRDNCRLASGLRPSTTASV